MRILTEIWDDGTIDRKNEPLEFDLGEIRKKAQRNGPKIEGTTWTFCRSSLDYSLAQLKLPPDLLVGDNRLLKQYMDWWITKDIYKAMIADRTNISQIRAVVDGREQLFVAPKVFEPNIRYVGFIASNEEAKEGELFLLCYGYVGNPEKQALMSGFSND